MASSPNKAAAGGRKDASNPLATAVLADQFGKELLRQREFGKMWGSLISPNYPKTFQDHIALRKAELERLTSHSGAVAANPFTTTTRAEYSNTKEIEGKLGKAYRALKAGV